MTPFSTKMLLLCGPVVGGLIGYTIASVKMQPPPAPPTPPTPVECRCHCEVDCCPEPLPHGWED